MSRNAWISVSIFAVLLVLVFATREDKVSVGVRSLSLPSFFKDKVSSIELGGKHKAVLTRDGDAWKVSDPAAADKKFAVEGDALSRALDALAELEAGAFVTGRAAKHEELDLTEEKGLHVKIAQDGGTMTNLVFGRAAKGGGNYLRLAGSDEVFVGAGRFASLVSKDVKAWRKRKLIETKADEIASITLAPSGGETYTVESFDEGEGDAKKTGWRLATGTALPEGFVPDDALIKRIGSSVANLRAADFADDGGAGVGDAPSAGKVTVKTKTGEQIVIRFGDEDDKKRRFAKLDGDEQVYLVSAFNVTSVLKTKDALRDLSLARFDATTIERVLIKGGAETVELTKADGSWTMTQPSTPPAGYEFDPATVDGKLTALGRVKATSRLDAPPAGGLGKTAATVTLFIAGGAQKTIVFGGDVPKKEEGDAAQAYVQGAEESVPYVIGTWQRDRYGKPLDLFKKVAAPPMPPGGGAPGGIPGMENLPPDVRKKLMESMRQQGMPGR